MAKILVYSPSFIGKSMTGAAIRSWEFAKSLAANPLHEVVLISPNRPEIQSNDFKIFCQHDVECKKYLSCGEILITQRLTFPLALRARYHKLKVIIDAYDPSPLELFEHYKDLSLSDCQNHVNAEISTLLLSFRMAHGILCASEAQRKLWIGFLLSQKLISSELYHQDRSLQKYINIVPFGLPFVAPHKNGPGFREKYGLSPQDKVILWGGGIWDWFDPLTLIQAIKICSLHRKDIKLIFMGVKPPDPSIKETSISRAAMNLAKELDVLNKSVFFNHEWISYEERHNFLLEADIGISTHFNHLETSFSFRTRILDYLWAQLPIITTEGDTFAQLVERHDLGIVVPFQNVEALAKAILALIDHPERLAKIKLRMSSIREQFYWSTLLHPLNEMISRLSAYPAKKLGWQDGTILTRFIISKIKEKGLKVCLNKLYRQFT